MSRTPAEQTPDQRRLAAMAKAVALYEAEFGVISEAEIAAQRLADSRTAIVYRGIRA